MDPTSEIASLHAAELVHAVTASVTQLRNDAFP